MRDVLSFKKESLAKKESEEPMKKRGRKKKGGERTLKFKDQEKFFVDLSKDREGLKQVHNLLEETNKKDYGQEVTFKELVLHALEKLGSKDIEKIKEESLTKMEKVERARKEYNKKSGKNLGLEEFLVKKLGLN